MFKIKIEQVQVVTRMVGKEWMQIGVKEDGKPEFGYTPLIEKDVEEETMVYTQQVDQLGLVKVINAVNEACDYKR